MPAERRRSLWLALTVIALIASALASMSYAQEPTDRWATPPDAASALLAVRDADPLELARVVQRVRDRAILDLLADTQPVAVRIAAMRASEWLIEPEIALPALPHWIVSRDADLAEAAARAAFAITRKLDADALARREADLTALAAVAAALHAVEHDASWARADLIALAHAAAAELEAAGVSSPTARPTTRPAAH